MTNATEPLDVARDHGAAVACDAYRANRVRDCFRGHFVDWLDRLLFRAFLGRLLAANLGQQRSKRRWIDIDVNHGHRIDDRRQLGRCDALEGLAALARSRLR